ncbi:MAG: hypothetical protein OXH47_10125 [Paracoccaceae bacterium]|nr:hypothetical protein [Paracoccaceae bacterium]
MGKYSLIRNPSTNTTSFGVVRNLIIQNQPQLASVEADIYLFLGFHKSVGFGFKHIQAIHGNEIRNAGFTCIEDFVVSILRPGTKLYYTGESWKKCRLLAWNQTGMGVLEFQENVRHGKH